MPLKLCNLLLIFGLHFMLNRSLRLISVPSLRQLSHGLSRLILPFGQQRFMCGVSQYLLYLFWQHCYRMFELY